jgi:hypothetical protein
MTKRSKYENEQRAAQTARIKEIEAAWLGSVESETMKLFRADVQAARSRPPAERQPDMAPGTAPRPPRFEPPPKKEEKNPRRGRD